MLVTNVHSTLVCRIVLVFYFTKMKNKVDFLLVKHLLVLLSLFVFIIMRSRLSLIKASFQILIFWLPSFWQTKDSIGLIYRNCTLILYHTFPIKFSKFFLWCCMYNLSLFTLHIICKSNEVLRNLFWNKLLKKYIFTTSSKETN